MAIYHWHHIVPRHAGGTDDPENLVRVTVEEHAELHLARYLEYGEENDWLAYNGLAKLSTKEEIVSQLMRSGGSKGGKSRSEAKRASAQINLAKGRVEKPVMLIDKDGNTFIYSSLKDAAEDKNLHRRNLSSVALGNRKTVGGYTARLL
jgi:hypothetical protein